MPTTIQHDAHRPHRLVLRSFCKFICDGCECNGAGPRYRCDACDFDLHELCATAPPTALFAGQHPLAFEAAAAPADEPRRRCRICDTPILGMHYRCRPCGFAVHPVCSQLPGAAVSPLHPEHLVMLTVGAPGMCAACGAGCVWRYRCGVCDFNLHPKCLLGIEETPLNIPKSSCVHQDDLARAPGRLV
ncbi:hypothetical protein ACP70R_016679 [Stipagrostis hirtigluma subsp. patula]